MTPAERQAAISAAVQRERQAGKLEWWWLSFVDPGLAVGSQFLGACIVRAYGMGDACRVAHLLGINPGGAVHGLPAPEGLEPPPKWAARLLTARDCMAFEAEMRRRESITVSAPAAMKP